MVWPGGPHGGRVAAAFQRPCEGRALVVGKALIFTVAVGMSASKAERPHSAGAAGRSEAAVGGLVMQPWEGGHVLRGLAAKEEVPREKVEKFLPSI